jgi:UDPglucose 6-dehydrogenase
VNERQKTLLVDRLVHRLGDDLSGRKIAVWGLAFKPNTDDMREAPSRVVIKSLLMRGAHVVAYDPVAGHEAMAALRLDCANEAEILTRLTLAAHDMEALHDVDALLVLTEWKNFHNPDFQAMKRFMRSPYILDGRNLYNPEALADLGIAYQGIGRRNDLVNLPADPILLEQTVLNA